MPDPLRPPRTCEGCRLCCTCLGVPDLGKPADTACQHAQPGPLGCTIYQDRPSVCREYSCMWLLGQLPDWAEPRRTGLVVDLTLPGNAFEKEMGIRGCLVVRAPPDSTPGVFTDYWGKRLVDHLSRRALVILTLGQSRRLVGPAGLVASAADFMRKRRMI